MDDGSDPPIHTNSNLVRVIITNDKREWTWPVARNTGARWALGEYFLMTDLDYIIPRSAIEAALSFTGDKMRFRREFGVLDENGVFTQDKETLISYGLPRARLDSRKRFTLPPHPNNFVMRASAYWAIGGYTETRIGQPYPQREDGLFKRTWMKAVADGRFKDHDERPTIYMFPNGQFCGSVDHNPFGLFHNLSRKTSKNPAYTKQRRHEKQPSG